MKTFEKLARGIWVDFAGDEEGMINAIADAIQAERERARVLEKAYYEGVTPKKELENFIEALKTKPMVNPEGV